MDLTLMLEHKLITPGSINLTQFSNNTDILTFKMDEYLYNTSDLSLCDCYALCDLPQGLIDEVKLTTTINDDGKLVITWPVTGYSTQKNGVVTYQICFKNAGGLVWNSNKAIMFVNSALNVDTSIVGKYPTILQQWENRMNKADINIDTILAEAESAKDTAISKAEEAGMSADTASSSADTATTQANKAEAMKDIISELVNYEPTNMIEQEVTQARGEYTLLNERLNAQDASDAKKLPLTGGTLTGDLDMANGTKVLGKTKAGAITPMVHIDNADVVCLGDTSQPIGICSLDLPYWYDGTDKKDLATEAYVTTAIGNITGLDVVIVESLPTTGKSSTIYFVSDNKSETDIYDEYMWINGKWELIGNTKIDLSAYYTKTEIDTKQEASHEVVLMSTEADYIPIANRKPNKLYLNCTELHT